jgi:hypothetical protein
MKPASWVNVLLGLWLIISPWVLRLDGGAAAANNVALGFLVLIVAIFSIVAAPENHAAAWVNVGAGIWVFISPWVVGYATQSAALKNDAVVGVLVVLFGLLRMAGGGHPIGRARELRP